MKDRRTPDPLQFPPEPRETPFDPHPHPHPPFPHSETIAAALDRDPVLRELPSALRQPVEDALRTLDETLLNHAIDILMADDDAKSAVRAAALAVLKLAKGERFEVPTPPLHEMPPSVAPAVPSAPGETIFRLPAIKF